MNARLGACGLLAAGFALTFLLDPWQHERVSDLPLYASYAELFFDGWLPFRDIGFEYPPLAAPLIALPGFVSVELDTYRLLFAGLVLGVTVATLFSVERLAVLTGGDRLRALLAFAALPLLAGAVIRTHFDLAPLACLCAGIAAIAGRHPRAGFALLGVGGALKAFPLLAVPVAAVWLAGRGRAREGLLGCAIALGVVAVVAAGAVALSPDGAWDSVEYHLERPLQIESLPATLLNAWEWSGGNAPEPVHSHNSDGLEHAAAGELEAAFAVILALALVALVTAAYRLPDARGMVLASLATVAAFATLSKVLSPQFMLWLGPLAALAWAWRMHALAICAATAIAATQLWFPERYFDLVAREEWPVAAVALRNGLLVATLVLIARELRASLRGLSPQ